MSRNRRKSGWFGRNTSRRRYADEGGGGSFGSGAIEFWRELSPEVKKGIFIILLFAFCALSVLGLFDLSGQFGQATNYALSIVLGNLKWLFPLLIGIWIFLLLNEEKYPIRFINYFGVFLFILGLAGLFHLPFDSFEALKAAKNGYGGGYLGAMIAMSLIRLMSFWGALIMLVAILLIGLLLALETSIYGIMWPIKLFRFLWDRLKDWRAYQKLKKQEREITAEEEEYEEEPAVSKRAIAAMEAEADQDEDAGEADEDEVPGFVKTEVKMGFNRAVEEEERLGGAPKKYGPIDIPIGLLNSKTGKPTSGDIKANQDIIKKCLENFGIPVEMGEVNVGPTITQYTMRPTDGIRLSRITTLNADLALALAAHPIRIEAPIPGKSLIGIELPNVQAAKVNMGEMLSSKEYKNRPNNLSVALGKDVSGKPIFASLDKMPHLLVAGATGSGKSVCINSIIISLMYMNSPDELKFILVDPKRVELPAYNGTPYLLTPVITDVKKTVGALKWAITEMERRFELLSKFGNRNIASYNQTHADKLPYIIIIIDELADLMATAGNDMEAGIVRLAQMARAIGIHLILATQRPSTEVITGLIKANIPGRIAFSVASSIDSRTILDGTGAEKLVGRGDMLYLGPEFAKPKRIQGVFLSDKEVTDVVRFIKSHGPVEYDEKLTASTTAGFGMSGGGLGGDSDEPLVMEAVEVIKESGKASASLLQRRLKLGYARAARILDILEEKGIIGPADGAKPREIFLDAIGGVNPVDFAAKEHGLTGELRPMEDDEEPSFTAFAPKPQAGIAPSEDDWAEETEPPKDELLEQEEVPEIFAPSSQKMPLPEEDDAEEGAFEEEITVEAPADFDAEAEAFDSAGESEIENEPRIEENEMEAEEKAEEIPSFYKRFIKEEDDAGSIDAKNNQTAGGETEDDLSDEDSVSDEYSSHKTNDLAAAAEEEEEEEEEEGRTESEDAEKQLSESKEETEPDEDIEDRAEPVPKPRAPSRKATTKAHADSGNNKSKLFDEDEW